jgi:hypothetical protein
VHPQQVQLAELGRQLQDRHLAAVEPLAGVGDDAVADERAHGVADVALLVGEQLVGAQEILGPQFGTRHGGVE